MVWQSSKFGLSPILPWISSPSVQGFVDGLEVRALAPAGRLHDVHARSGLLDSGDRCELVSARCGAGTGEAVQHGGEVSLAGGS